ncbi:peptidase A4 family-domain-containing protein [Lentinula raphanica]|nr:peptidase A4 family-domain-containing protein [Lentinula raphanica]
MMLKVLTATLLLTSILFSTDAQPVESPPSANSPNPVSVPRSSYAGITVSPPTLQRIDKVTGRFHLPQPVPLDPQTKFANTAFWVGISGYLEYPFQFKELVQAGVAMVASEKGDIAFQAFYEWHPDKEKWVEGSTLELHAGDEVEVSIEMKYNCREADILITNRTTGKHFKQDGIYPSRFDAEHRFTGFKANWVVEFFRSTPGRFKEVDFFDCSATTDKGTKLDLSESDERGIISMGKKVAHTEVIIEGGQGISKFKVLHDSSAAKSSR